MKERPLAHAASQSQRSSSAQLKVVAMFGATPSKTANRPSSKRHQSSESYLLF
jgi:hypothetical protein